MKDLFLIKISICKSIEMIAIGSQIINANLMNLKKKYLY